MKSPLHSPTYQEIIDKENEKALDEMIILEAETESEGDPSSKSIKEDGKSKDPWDKSNELWK